MHIQEKRIGGHSCYEIVEEVHLQTGVEYRVIASLGIEAEPENARRRRAGDAARPRTLPATA